MKQDRTNKTDINAALSSLQDVVRMLHMTFARRALTWETNEGELGKIVGSELRTVNDEWAKAMSARAKHPNERKPKNEGSNEGCESANK